MCGTVHPIGGHVVQYIVQVDMWYIISCVLMCGAVNPIGGCVVQYIIQVDVWYSTSYRWMCGTVHHTDGRVVQYNIQVDVWYSTSFRWTCGTTTCPPGTPTLTGSWGTSSWRPESGAAWRSRGPVHYTLQYSVHSVHCTC